MGGPARGNMWTCPDCGRSFGRRNQNHLCSPGMTVEEFFESSQPWERPIYDVLIDHLEQLGPVVIDPVQVGILFKNGPMFAEFRPMKRWVAVTFVLPVKLDHPRLARKVIPTGGRGGKWYHVINVASIDDVDAVLLDWLTEAYLAAEID